MCIGYMKQYTSVHGAAGNKEKGTVAPKCFEFSIQHAPLRLAQPVDEEHARQMAAGVHRLAAYTKAGKRTSDRTNEKDAFRGE